MQSKLYWAAFVALAGLAASPAAHAKMPLNDTGMRACVNFETNQFTNDCTDTGQDGEFGRDMTHSSSKNGRLGFSFKKICNSGEAAGTGSCPTDPQLGTSDTDWGCTKDLVTGLTWEIKSKTGNRAYDQKYTFKGALPNTVSFIKAVNASALCGATNWRLPTVIELMGITDYKAQKIDFTSFRLQARKVPNGDWFPDVNYGKPTYANDEAQWSSDQSVTDYAWTVGWGAPYSFSAKKIQYTMYMARIRLVH